MNHFPVLLITVAALMHPLQYDLRSSAAQDNSITHAAAAPSNLDAMVSEIAAPKPDLDAKSGKKTILTTF